MDDSEGEKEPDKKDERPAARPSKPIPRQMSNLDNYYAAQAKRDEIKRLKNEEFAKGKGPLLFKIFFGAAVVLIVVLAVFGIGGSSDMGKFECEEAVKSQLRSPSTASVGFLTNSQSSNNSSNWKHTGTVTAQNGFGAMITSGWTCYFEDGVARATVG